jgi:hypothetical protein
MRLTDVEFTVLADISDEYYMLWEVEWGLNTQYPEQRGGVNHRLAVVVLGRLFDRGLVEAFWSDEQILPFEAMTATEFHTELDNAARWDPQKAPQPWVLCSTSELGWQVYLREFRARHSG